MRASLFLLGVATSLAAEPWLLVHKDAPFGLDHAVCPRARMETSLVGIRPAGRFSVRPSRYA